jgi:UDP-glucuronate 4-epimerase
MRILVTGAAGFIGSHLCEKLADLNHEVFGIDNYNSYYDINLKRMNAEDLKNKGVSIFEIDLIDHLEHVFLIPYDYIFHLAAQPGISSTTPLTDYVKNNIYATQNLIESVLKWNLNLKSFINISTSSVYGIQATVNETEITKPISFYGTTKLAAEQLVLAQQRIAKINACSIRLYSVYGPRERPEKLYTKLIKNLYENEAFTLFEGSLYHERSFSYVGDIVEGLASIIGKETDLNGEIVNLGTDEVNTTKDGIEIIQRILNKKLIINHQPARKGDQEKTAAVIDKAKSLLNYSPKTLFIDGLKKQVKWYQEKFVN